MGEISSVCRTIFENFPDSAEKFRESRIHRIVDGDTFIVDGELCVEAGVALKGKNEECLVRLLGINTPEKIKRSRKELEEGSISALEFLERLILGQTVYLKLKGERDSYGRLLIEKTYLPTETKRGSLGVYVDVHARIVREGYGHIFAFSKDEEKIRKEYLSCQEEAKKEKRGIWNTSRYQGNLHITSFHANGSRYPGLDCTIEDEPPNCEYFRMANISSQTINLKNYSVENCETQERMPLPEAELPVGAAIKVHSGKGENQLDFEKGELKVYLGRENQFWDNKGAMVVIRGGDGKVHDYVSSRKAFICKPKEGGNKP